MLPRIGRPITCWPKAVLLLKNKVLCILDERLRLLLMGL